MLDNFKLNNWKHCSYLYFDRKLYDLQLTHHACVEGKNSDLTSHNLHLLCNYLCWMTCFLKCAVCFLSIHLCFLISFCRHYSTRSYLYIPTSCRKPPFSHLKVKQTDCSWPLMGLARGRVVLWSPRRRGLGRQRQRSAAAFDQPCAWKRRDGQLVALHLIPKSRAAAPLLPLFGPLTVKGPDGR